MPNGEKTPEATVAEFRAHYLLSGNASASAREVGIPERTGRDLAQACIDDPEFTEARRKLRANALEELVAMRMRVATTALDRFENGFEEHSSKGDNVTIIDKRPDYGKLVLEAEKNAHALAKAETPTESGQRHEVEIRVIGPGASAEADA